MKYSVPVCRWWNFPREVASEDAPRSEDSRSVDPRNAGSIPSAVVHESARNPKTASSRSIRGQEVNTVESSNSAVRSPSARATGSAETARFQKPSPDTEEEDERDQPDIDVTKRTSTTTENGGGRGARTIRTQVERRRLRNRVHRNS